METKILVDGFRIDSIETPKPGDNLADLALTPIVKELLGDRVIASIIPAPIENPRLILITTEL
jgi:hypothetical protein